MFRDCSNEGVMGEESIGLCDFGDEDTISLCDLPMTQRASLEDTLREDPPPSQDQDQFEFFNYLKREDPLPSQDQDQDQFEFFNYLKIETCAADDIFFSAKLHPYNDDLSTSNNSHRKKTPDKLKLDRALNSYSPTASTPVTRISEKKSNGYRSFSKPKSSSSSFSSYSPPKPKWYMLLFGSMNVSTKMDMRDLRNRLRRRNPSVFLPVFDKSNALLFNGKVVGVVEKRPPKLIHALSWKGYVAGVQTQPPISCCFPLI